MIHNGIWYADREHGSPQPPAPTAHAAAAERVARADDCFPGRAGRSVCGRLGRRSVCHESRAINQSRHEDEGGASRRAIGGSFCDATWKAPSTIDLKCEVEKGSAISGLSRTVTKSRRGQVGRVDSAALEEQVNTQRITYEKARASMIQAEKDFRGREDRGAGIPGRDVVTELLKLDSNITIASENLRSAQNALEHSNACSARATSALLDLASQKFSVQRAHSKLDSAHTAKDVLTKYTKVKMVQELESKRDSSEAMGNSEKASFALEESPTQAAGSAGAQVRHYRTRRRHGRLREQYRPPRPV